jgi:hypothetical protein
LTGHDSVFNIHFIGELKTRKINPSIRNIQIKLIIELSVVGLENENFIHSEK